MKQRSLFSLSAEHKARLRYLAASGNRSMTAQLEKLIDGDYKHAEEYASYLRGEVADPRD